MQIAGYIADDLTNTSPGYGFMMDFRNRKLYDRRAFFDTIMGNSVLHQQFVIAMGPDGVPLLNLGRLRQWLQDYSDALLYLMAAIEVLAGSPSRGTELTCIQLQNTACRSQGLYVLGHCLALVIQYSKTSATKGRDTLIPHVLHAFCQEYAKIVAFWTHPFAEQVVQILFPGRTALLSLWHNHFFVKFNHLFMTEDLSGVLRAVILRTMDVSIGVWDYRQMSVCIRRAHCPRMSELMAFGDEEDIASLQAGHSTATEERCYGISAGYLGQLPENMVQPFAAASAEWQVVMRIPEGGKKVQLSDFPVKELWGKYLSPEKPNHVCYACKKGGNDGGPPNGMHHLSHNTAPSPRQSLHNSNLQDTFAVTTAVNIAATSSSSPSVRPTEPVSGVSSISVGKTSSTDTEKVSDNYIALIKMSYCIFRGYWIVRMWIGLTIKTLVPVPQTPLLMPIYGISLTVRLMTTYYRP